jgi:polyferredoxin
MLLDYLPFKRPKSHPKKGFGAIRYIHFFFSLGLVIVLYFVLDRKDNLLQPKSELMWLIIGNIAYYVIAIILAFVTKDNRAFCKYVCPIPVLMKPGARCSLMRMQIDAEKCIDCKKCEKNCPMSIKLLDYKNKGKRVSSTECIVCNTCVNVCPTRAINATFGVGDKMVVK